MKLLRKNSKGLSLAVKWKQYPKCSVVMFSTVAATKRHTLDADQWDVKEYLLESSNTRRKLPFKGQFESRNCN